MTTAQVRQFGGGAIGLAAGACLAGLQGLAAVVFHTLREPTRSAHAACVRQARFLFMWPC